MPAPHHLSRELSSLARLAAPMAAATAGQALMGVVDTAVCGRAGAETLAGAALGNTLFFAVAVVGMGIILGLEPLVSQAIGAGDAARARHWLWQGGWLALALGAVLSVPLAALPAVLEPLGIPREVSRQAGPYLWLRLPGFPAFLFYFAVRAYLQGHGRTRAVIVAVAFANVVNLALDLVLVFGGAGLPAWTGPLRHLPALGAGGSAIATSIATWLQAAILVFAADRLSRPAPAAARPSRRPVPAELARALRVGAPVGLHMGAEVGIFALVGFLSGRLGTLQVAAHQIALACASFTFCFVIGIGEAGGVRVGWAVGAGDPAAARRSGFTAVAAGAAVMSMSALVFLLFPRAVARLVTDDPRVLELAVPLLSVAAVFQLADGVQGVSSGVLRGAADTRYTFAANMVGHWLVGLPVALGLGFGARMGVVGLWWGLCAGLFTVALALLARFARISARGIRPVEAREAARAPAGG